MLLILIIAALFVLPASAWLAHELRTAQLDTDVWPDISEEDRARL